MPTRREVLKGGGGAVLAGLAGSVAADAAGAATTRAAGAAGTRSPTRDRQPTGHPGSDRGGAGPLYWSTYGYENIKNILIPEDVWKTNVDWVAGDLP